MFLWCLFKQAVEQTVESLVIYVGIAMTLTWWDTKINFCKTRVTNPMIITNPGVRNLIRIHQGICFHQNGCFINCGSVCSRRIAEPASSLAMGLLPDTLNCGCACAGNAGTFSPTPRVSDPDIHHGTCVTHVPWCMPGSLTSGFLWSRWWRKMCPAFPAYAQPAILRI